MIEEGEKNDDRDRDPKKPQQDSSAHDQFLSTSASDRRKQTRSLWNCSKLCIIFAQFISRVQLTRSTVHLAETTTNAQGGRQGDFASRNSRGNNSTGGVLDRLVTRFPCPPAPSASFCPVRVVLGRGFFGLGQGHDWGETNDCRKSETRLVCPT